MKITSQISLVFALLFVAQGPLLSDESHSRRETENAFFRTIRANQEDSYITLGGGLGNIDDLVFEALVAPYFLLRTSENARLGATISSPILVRMYNEYSFPVRTPSYMPQVSFYYQTSGRSDENVSYLFLTLAHHSNGQDDPFFNENGSINRHSGDFSTNYVEFGAFFNRQLIPFSNTAEYFSTSLEYHVDVGRSPELNDRYSFIRWHNSIRIFRFPVSLKNLRLEKTPRVQSRLETTWLFGNFNDASFFDIKERLNLSFTIAYRPEFLSDVSLFFNIYTGEDYYNMHFDRRLNGFRVGLQAYGFR